MKRLLQTILIPLVTVTVRCKEPELPLCPTNVQFFPQTLPMHCRMPPDAKTAAMPNEQTMTLPPFPPNFFQTPTGDAPPNPIPFPLPPGMPAPGPFPMPMPMPMAPSGPAQKLPLIVMPFYSPDPSFKRPQPGVKKRRLTIHSRRPDIDDSSCSDIDTSSDSQDTSADHYWRGLRSGRHRGSKLARGSRGSRGAGGFRRSGKKHQAKEHKHRHKHTHGKGDLLTPVLQYVTKDGYVIFEKKISKTEAKDWLSTKKEANDQEGEVNNKESAEETNDAVETPDPDTNADVEILDQGKNNDVVEELKNRVPKKHLVRKNKPSRLHQPKEAKEDDKSKDNTA